MAGAPYVTPIYQLVAPGTTPVWETADQLALTVDRIEAALVRGGIAPPAAQDLATLAGRVTTLEGLPICALRKATAQTIGAGWLPITFDNEIYDPGDMHKAATPSRVTVPVKGLYRFAGTLPFAPTTATVRIGAQWRVNGGVIPPASSFTVGGTMDYSVAPPTLLWPLNAGDYVEMFGLHNAASMVSPVYGDVAASMSVECVRRLT